jgi:hypothetical protein
MLLFFAFTGALQTFSLHETTKGSSYKPPAWAVTLGQIHKKQTPVVPVKKVPPPSAAPETHAGADQQAGPEQQAAPKSDAPHGEKKQHADAATPGPEQAAQKHHPLPLKIFFLIVAISLFLSTLTGIYMSYKYVRNRILITALLILGTVIPIVLVFV